MSIKLPFSHQTLANSPIRNYNQDMDRRESFISRALAAAGLLAILLSGCPETELSNSQEGPDKRATGIHPDKRGDIMSIRLPEPGHRGITVEEALRERRSVREYSEKAVSMAELSELLFAAQGITGEIYGTDLRTAPSAGALYPMEVYVFAHSVEGLNPGLYHYRPRGHALDLIRKGNMRRKVSDAGLGQRPLQEAAVVIALTGVFNRTTGKYGERGIKYVLMEAGHVAQNVLLEVVSLGLGAVPIGAFNDEAFDQLIGLDSKNTGTLYLIALGRP